jgi:C1A family cysteine protease
MKDFSNYKFTIKPSPYDSRDLKFSKVYREIALPVKTENWLTMLPVRDQGSQGSCAAMAAAAMKEWQEIKDVGLAEYLSPQFIYNLRDDTSEEGMSNRDLMKILQDKGVCYEKSFPYGSTGKPNSTLISQASNFKISNYARIYSPEELKQALFIKGPCIVAVPVYNYGDRIWHQNPGDQFLGGHDMCITDFDDEGKYFRIRNSWGSDFGYDGYLKMPYDDFQLAWEFWSTVDLDTILPVDPPEPEKVGCWGRFWSWLQK